RAFDSHRVCAGQRGGRLRIGGVMRVCGFCGVAAAVFGCVAGGRMPVQRRLGFAGVERFDGEGLQE
ncbi:MAG: hypothetical protein N2322_02460, partial [Terrimicrobiaceae bacterium]|nr:hypothetical protein [Terrimicrobiaceae bacterium]